MLTQEIFRESQTQPVADIAVAVSHDSVSQNSGDKLPLKDIAISCLGSERHINPVSSRGNILREIVRAV